MKNRYKVRKEFTTIYVDKPNGEVIEFIIDNEDFERLSKEWPIKMVAWLNPCTKTYYGVFSRKIPGGSRKSKTTYLHRAIMDAPKGMLVDHINHDTTDNRKENLRICTASENQQNRKRKTHGASGIRGVNFDKRFGKWYGRIYVDGKSKYLGYFETLKGAETAVRTARMTYQTHYNDRI